MLDEIDFRNMFKSVGIIGTGLMGGSFGKAIKSRIPDIEVIGFDLNLDELNTAKQTNCIDIVAKDLKELGQRSDLIVLATPIRTYASILKALPTEIWMNTWLMDLGSVKMNAHKDVQEILPKFAKFVGGHPMAGSEKCGCINCDENLFEGAAFYLTAEDETLIEPIKSLVEAIGCDVRTIDPFNHDRIVSVSSHVPHVTASMLVSILHDDISIHETGGGYQDTTRIAGSDPVMWTDIMLTNKDAILKSLDQLHSELHKVIGMIDREDEKAIFNYLEKTKRKRLQKGGHTNGNNYRRKAI